MRKTNCHKRGIWEIKCSLFDGPTGNPIYVICVNFCEDEKWGFLKSEESKNVRKVLILKMRGK